jgi:uncharacterized membrane protein YbhN (UPF0104 family)
MKRWQFWVGFLISALFLWWALNKLNLGDFWKAISTANYWWILPGIAVYFVAVWARAWRWHYLLKPIKAIKTRVMFPVTCIGYMGNNIYPARAGEVLRAVVLKRREGVPVSASLATIIVEKFFDAVVMLGFVFVNLPELARLKGSHVSAGHGKVRTVVYRPAGALSLAWTGLWNHAQIPGWTGISALTIQYFNGVHYIRSHLAVGNRQVLVRDARLQFSCQLFCLNADEWYR